MNSRHQSIFSFETLLEREPQTKLAKIFNVLDCNLVDHQWGIENSIRPFTIGRKNWLFSGSPKGAVASASVYSVIETAKANGLNPYKYLKFIFQDLPGVQFGQYPEFLEDYLPWNPKIQEKCK